jgi:hypothetical protein
VVLESPARATWLSTFPWALTSLDDSALRRIDFYQYLDETSIEIGQEAVEALSTFALERLHRWSLFEIFPFVPSALRLNTLSLSVRATNLLDYRVLTKFEDLGEMSVETLLTWRNSGVTTVALILNQLCWANFQSALELGTDKAPEPGGNWNKSFTSIPKSNPFVQMAAGHLSTLAEWQIIRGAPESALLEPAALLEPIPSRVREARDWLLSVDARTWVGAERKDQRVAQLIAGHISGLEAREVTILTDRILSKTPSTLDALGLEFGITRERVRQIETRLTSLLRLWVESDTKLGNYSLAVRQRINKLSRLDSLLNQMPELRELIAGAEMPAWYILDIFDDSIESDGIWIADPSLSELRRRTILTFQEAESAPGIAPFSDLRSAFTDLNHLSDEDLGSWLTNCGYLPFLDHFVSATIKSIPDLAFAYLHVTGLPATIDEIQEHAFPDRSLRSAKNVILNDSRLVRVGRHSVGLREWGVREYTGIRDAIDSIVTTQNEVRLDELIANLTSDFDVSPKSITVYAGSWPFETVNGIVRRAEQSVPSSKPLSQTRNVYLVEDKFRLVLTASADHLRGSGFAIATSLATALSISPGEKRPLASSPSAITLSWMNTQPSLGSIRAQLQELDAGVGDAIAIDLDQMSATVSKLRATEEEDLRSRLGLAANVPLVSSKIAAALGLSPAAPWAIVIQTLRDRGESTLADQIVAEVGSNPAYDLAPASKTSKFRIISVDDA